MLKIIRNIVLNMSLLFLVSSCNSNAPSSTSVTTDTNIFGNYKLSPAINLYGLSNNTVDSYILKNTSQNLYKNYLFTENPVSIAITPDEYYIVGKYFYVLSRYSKMISMYSLADNGSLTPLNVNGSNTIVTGSNPIQIITNNNNAYVVNNGNNTVSMYSVGNYGVLAPLIYNNSNTVNTGNSPVSITATANAAYVVNQVDSTISMYSIESGGALNSLNVNGSNTVVTGNLPVSLKVNGSYAYVINTADNTISMYTVSSNGGLNPLNIESGTNVINTGLSPVGMEIHNNYMYVLNQVDKTISMYTISANGNLTLTTNIVNTGNQPTIMTINKNMLYVINQMDNTISSYFISGSSGILTLDQTAAMINTKYYSSISIYNSMAYITLPGANAIQAGNVANNILAFTLLSTAQSNQIPTDIASVYNYAYVLNSDSSISDYIISADFTTSLVKTNAPVAFESAPNTNNNPIAIATNKSFAYTLLSNPGVGNFVLAYKINVSSGALSLVEESANPVNVGNKPNAIALNDQFAYVLNSQDNNISMFTIGKNGLLTAINDNGSNTIKTGNTPSAMQMIGSFVYVTNKEDSTLSMYNINLNNGQLSPLMNGKSNLVTTGLNPISFVANKNYLYTLNSGDNTISMYSIDTNGVVTILNSPNPIKTTCNNPQKIYLWGNLIYINCNDGIDKYTVGQNGILVHDNYYQNGPTGQFDSFSSGSMLLSSIRFGVYQVSTLVFSLLGFNYEATAIANAAVGDLAYNENSKFAYLIDSNSNRINEFVFGMSGELINQGKSDVSFKNPIDLAVSDKYLYTVDSAAKKVIRLKIKDDGKLDYVVSGKYITPTGNLPQSITLYNNFAYVGNCADNSISMFSVSAEDGSLSALATPVLYGQLCIGKLYNLNSIPNTLLGINKNSGTISVFNVKASGILSRVGALYETGAFPLKEALVTPDSKYVYSLTSFGVFLNTINNNNGKIEFKKKGNVLRATDIQSIASDGINLYVEKTSGFETYQIGADGALSKIFLPFNGYVSTPFSKIWVK